MRKRKSEKAACSAVASKVGGPESKRAVGSGLGSNLTGGRFVQADLHLAASRYECADGSGRRPLSANMPVPLRSKRCGGRSPQILRRMTAAPLNVAFSFGGIRTHGLIAPALYRSCGLMPCGEPLRSPFPKLRYFLHPHGVAHPVGRMGGFQQFNLGACHE